MLIYLDSQDYSRLSDPRTADQDANRALASLMLAASLSHKARIPFSNLHVQEAVQEGASSRQLALGRARLMSALSRGQVFAPFEHIVSNEVFAAISELGHSVAGGQDLRKPLVRADGVWWPWEAMADEGPLNLRAALIAQARANPGGLNRAARRDRERLAGNSRAFVKSELPNLVAWIKDNFPASSKLIDRRFLTDFLMGKIDQSRFYDEMMRSALDLETYVSWTVEKLDHGKLVASYIKVSGYELAAKIEDLLRRLERSQPKTTPSADLDAALAKVRSEGIEKVSNSMRRGILAAGLRLLLERTLSGERKENSDALLENLTNYSGDRTPGIDVVCSCFTVWMGLVSAPSASRQSVLRSDVLDILHAIYLPYVDAFRVDARFSNTLRQAKTRHLSKVISSSGDLATRVASL